MPYEVIWDPETRSWPQAGENTTHSIAGPAAVHRGGAHLLCIQQEEVHTEMFSDRFIRKQKIIVYTVYQVFDQCPFYDLQSLNSSQY